MMIVFGFGILTGMLLSIILVVVLLIFIQANDDLDEFEMFYDGDN